MSGTTTKMMQLQKTIKETDVVVLVPFSRSFPTKSVVLMHSVFVQHLKSKKMKEYWKNYVMSFHLNQNKLCFTKSSKIIPFSSWLHTTSIWYEWCHFLLTICRCLSCLAFDKFPEKWKKCWSAVCLCFFFLVQRTKTVCPEPHGKTRHTFASP